MHKFSHFVYINTLWNECWQHRVNSRKKSKQNKYVYKKNCNNNIHLHLTVVAYTLVIAFVSWDDKTYAKQQPTTAQTKLKTNIFERHMNIWKKKIGKNSEKPLQTAQNKQNIHPSKYYTRKCKCKTAMTIIKSRRASTYNSTENTRYLVMDFVALRVFILPIHSPVSVFFAFCYHP